MTTEEIQEVLAEFENRISFLENMLPYPASKKDLRPIKAELNYILNKINTHTAINNASTTT